MFLMAAIEEIDKQSILEKQTTMNRSRMERSAEEIVKDIEAKRRIVAH